MQVQRTCAIYFNERAYNTRAFVRRYHLRLWIVAVYKFGDILTDYKYRLSQSEYIINSFINSGGY